MHPGISTLWNGISFFLFFISLFFKYGVSSHLLYCPCWKCVDVNRRVCVNLEMGWVDGWDGVFIPS